MEKMTYFLKYMILGCLCLPPLISVNVQAETVTVCYGYGCQTQKPVHISPDILKAVGQQFARSQSAEEERRTLSQMVGYLYIIAGEQTPIHRDREGNYMDDPSQDGAMDCIDHSVTAMRFLKLIERQGWLRYHQVGKRVKRGMFLNVHWTATIKEKQTGNSFAVDRWFYSHGRPAAVMKLDDWLAEKDPIVPGQELSG